MNWQLLSGINSALACMESNHNWDLSIGENARLMESFYNSLENGLPESKAAWVDIFELAYIATWSHDHTCDTISDSELFTFITCMADCYDKNYKDEVDPLKYCKSIGVAFKGEK